MPFPQVSTENLFEALSQHQDDGYKDLKHLPVIIHNKTL